MNRTACLERLERLASSVPKTSHSSAAVDAINRLATPAARTLAKGEIAVHMAAPPLLEVKVRTRIPTPGICAIAMRGT
jgi:hypothetical protein